MVYVILIGWVASIFMGFYTLSAVLKLKKKLETIEPLMSCVKAAEAKKNTPQTTTEA